MSQAKRFTSVAVAVLVAGAAVAAGVAPVEPNAPVTPIAATDVELSAEIVDSPENWEFTRRRATARCRFVSPRRIILTKP